jgi:hypothetical protein
VGLRNELYSPLFPYTLEGCIALPELHEAATLSELFLVEEQSIRYLIDVMNEANGCKDSPYVDFNHTLFEVVIDLEQECGSWLLFDQRLETSSVFLQGTK